MWDCEHCGCQAIAGTLTFCPSCFTPRPTQDVAAGPPTPNASASSIAVEEDREAPQPLIEEEIGSVQEGEWGSSGNGKDH